MEPDAVTRARARADDHWYQLALAALLGNYFVSPAERQKQPVVRLRAKQVQGIATLIGKKHIRIAILIHIDKTQSGVDAGRIDDGRSGRQTEGRLLPGLLGIRPVENSGLRIVADDQFALTVVVQVTQADTAIAAGSGG